MRKRTGAFLKQSLAVMMSLSMAFGPCAPGIRPVFGAQTEAGIDVAGEETLGSDVAAEEEVSALEEAPERMISVQEEAATASDASTASDSDAELDEDGFLTDGNVKNDVKTETIPVFMGELQSVSENPEDWIELIAGWKQIDLIDYMSKRGTELSCPVSVLENSNPSVVEISEYGYVNPIEAGDTIVRIRDNENVETTIQVAVFDQPKHGNYELAGYYLNDHSLNELVKDSSIEDMPQIVSVNYSDSGELSISSDYDLSYFTEEELGIHGYRYFENLAFYDFENYPENEARDYFYVTLGASGNILEYRGEEKSIVYKLIGIETCSIGDGNLILPVGNEKQVVVSCMPENATIQTLTWSVQDENIAVIDEKGILHAKNVGETYITADLTDGTGKWFMPSAKLSVIPGQYNSNVKYQERYADSETPTLESFHMYDSDGNEKDLKDSGGSGSYEEVADCKRFEIGFDKRDNIQDVNVVLATEDEEYRLPAVYDDSSNLFVADVNFDNKEVFIESIDVEIISDKEIPEVSEDDSAFQGMLPTEEFADAAVTVHSGEEQKYSIDVTEAFKKAGKEVTKAALDVTISEIDNVTNGNLEETLGVSKALWNMCGYIVPGVDDKKYYVYTDYSDPKTAITFVQDITSAANSVVKYEISLQGDGEWTSWNDMADSLSMVTKTVQIGGAFYDYSVERENRDDELHNAFNAGAMDIQEYEQAKNRSEQLYNDKCLYTLFMSGIIPMLGSIAGGPLGMGIAAISGAISVSSDYFWNTRAIRILGNCPRTCIDVVSKGACGDNLYYILQYNQNSNYDASYSYTLKITGTGRMYDWSNHADDFTPWDGYKSRIEHVELSDDITYIGDHAFYLFYNWCDEFKLPSALTGIGDWSFSSCSDLTGELVFPDTISSIGEGAFEGCWDLTGELKFPPKMTKIEDYTFAGCSGLNGDLIIPEQITAIGEKAFSDCTGFSSVEISENVKTIGEYAFEECSSLKSVTLPSGLEEIPAGLFYKCSGILGELKIPKNVKSIGSYAFSECYGLSGDLVIPNNVQEIGMEAFYGCNFNGNLTLHESLKLIGWGAFYSCKYLQGSLVIPDSVKRIEDYAFCDCYGFNELHLPESAEYIGANAFKSFANDAKTPVNLVLPDNIKTIGDRAFDSNKFLTGYLILPARLSELGVQAFNTPRIEKYVFTGSVPEKILPSGLIGEDVRAWDAFVKSRAMIYYPSWDPSWTEEVRTNIGSDDIWIPYDEGTSPWLKEITFIYMSKNYEKLEPGQTLQLSVTISPEDANVDTELTWRSSDETVAVVDQNGLVRALKPGSAVITVVSKNGVISQECKVSVLPKDVPVTGVKINATEKNVNIGKTFQLAAWPQPTNATDKAVTWTSSNTAVAKVSSTGLVTAVKAGTAMITVKTLDGGKTATCKITVKAATVPVISVKINSTAKTLAPGAAFQLAAWPQPSNATNKAVTWSSSNTAVATVSSTGLVKAVKAGIAVITVKTVDGGKTATCKITVQEAAAPTVPVTSVKINTTEKTLEVGKTFQLAAWPQPANATNKAVTWYSFNTAVATVSSTGLVTAKGKGSTNVRVMTVDGGKIAYCKITVQEAAAPTVPVTSVKINTTAKTLEVGKTFQLAAWPQPTNATNKAVTWYSFNTAVATVSSTGLVTAKGKGSTNVRVMTKDGGKVAYCKITVKEATIPVTSVKINTSAKTMTAGSTFQLAAWPQPSTATNKNVTWSSSNPAVAKVSSTGLVKAVKAGTATITVKTADGGKVAYCRITVKEATVPVTEVKINTTAKTLEIGKTFQLAAWPQPSNATNKVVTWSSSNSAVATVSSTGLVKAVKAGTATITVKTADGGKIAYCKITVEDTIVIPEGYTVSAPTDVHWTDDFRRAYTFGKMEDGTVHLRYKYKICNAATGDVVYTGTFTSNSSNTSVDSKLQPDEIEKMTTGSWYFTVCAIDESYNQLSPEVRSDTKAYTRPNERLPKPTNVRWNGTKLLFDIPDSYKSKTNQCLCRISFDSDGDGSFERESGKYGKISEGIDMSSYMTEPGYYKATLQVYNTDPRVILPSEIVEVPVIYFEE